MMEQNAKDFVDQKDKGKILENIISEWVTEFSGAFKPEFPVCLLSIILFNRWKAKFFENCETLPDTSSQRLFYSSE